MRDAIIFVPGLAHDQETQSIDAVGARLIHALESHSVKGTTVFTLSDGKDEDFLDKQIKTRTATITRQDRKEGPPRPIIDLYGFDYRRALIGWHEQQKPIVQGLNIGRLLAANASRIVTNRPSKTFAQKMQTFYAGALFILLAAYMILLLATAAGTAIEAVKRARGGQQQQQQQQQQQAAPIAPQAAPPAATRGVWSAVRGQVLAAWSLVWSSWLGVMQAAVIFVAALGLFTKVNLKETLARVSTEMTSAVRYLATGERGGTLAGQFVSLLNYIEERELESGVKYRRIHAISYSFGTVVTLDALFPRDTPSQRLRRMDTLVTIGCPFDFIRTYWPHYFEGRKGWDDAPRKWVNIYSLADVLGSDFVDDVTTEEKVKRGMKLAGQQEERRPDDNVRFGQALSLEDYSLWEKLTLAGFRAHNCYWERGQSFDNSCFGDVVKHVYADDHVITG